MQKTTPQNKTDAELQSAIEAFEVALINIAARLHGTPSLDTIKACRDEAEGVSREVWVLRTQLRNQDLWDARLGIKERAARRIIDYCDNLKGLVNS